MEEHKIGETFRHGNVMLKVIEDPDDTCNMCYFSDRINRGLCSEDGKYCLGSLREDNTSVQYIFDGLALRND